MATRNTYIISAIVAIIVIVAISAFVLSGTPTTPTDTTTTTTSGPTTTTTTQTTTNTTTTPGGGGVTAVYLTADNIKFNGTNPTITVKANTPVTFKIENKESVPHNFVIEGAPGGASNLINQGQTAQVTVTLQPGTYKYSCTIHPGQMDGQIVAK